MHLKGDGADQECASTCAIPPSRPPTGAPPAHLLDGPDGRRERLCRAVVRHEELAAGRGEGVSWRVSASPDPTRPPTHLHAGSLDRYVRQHVPLGRRGSEHGRSSGSGGATAAGTIWRQQGARAGQSRGGWRQQWRQGRLRCSSAEGELVHERRWGLAAAAAALLLPRGDCEHTRVRRRRQQRHARRDGRKVGRREDLLHPLALDGAVLRGRGVAVARGGVVVEASKGVVIKGVRCIG